MNKWLISVSVAMAITAPTYAAGDAEAGKLKSQLCQTCHGPDGNGLTPPNTLWPKLAGQHPQYIQKQIANFKAGIRQNVLMSPMAATLATDQDVADVAAYFASQPQTQGQAKAEAVALGRQLFRGGNASTGVPACGGCHGPEGLGNPEARFPRISGQHADYVGKQLKDFRAGERANDPNGMMRGVAAHLSDAEIEAVAQYVQGLTP